MDINDSQLKYLFESFSRGTMTAASEYFNVAPSSVSRQIAALERELGVSLLEKGRHRVVLTPAGQLLVDYYQERMGRRDALVAALDDLRSTHRGSVSLATGQGLLGPILMPAVRAFRHSWPGIRVQVYEVSNQQAVNMVCNDEVHFSIIVETPEETRLRTRFRLSQSWRLVMRPEHPLALRPSVGLKELSQHDLVLASHGFRSRQLLERAAKEAQVALDPVITCASIPLVLDCVMGGLGVAVLNDLYVREAIARGRLVGVPLEHPLLGNVEVHGVVRAGRRLPRSALALLDQLGAEGGHGST